MTTAPTVQSRAVASSRALTVRWFIAWCAFILVHLWLGLLGLFGPGLPLGDVTRVYRLWTDQALVYDFWVGIDSYWVYPIVAIVPMLLAFSFGPDFYASTWLSMVMILNAVAFAMLTGTGTSTARMRAGWWWIGFLGLLGPIALGRIDSVTVPIALVGMLLLARHPTAASVVLTVATWIKVWPAALLAAIVIASRERRRIVTASILVSLAVIAIALAFGSGTNVFSFFTQQAGRGLQVEAPVSTVWLWLASAGVADSFVYYDQGILTYQVTGSGAEIASIVMTPLLGIVALLVCALGVLATRRGATIVELLPTLSLALVAVLIAVNKVGSPQFIMWLAVPVVIGLVNSRMAGGVSFRVPATLALLIAAFTQLVYPTFYSALLALNPVMLVVLTIRNVLTLAVVGWSVSELVHLARRRE